MEALSDRLEILRRLSSESDWFTVTRVSVRVPQSVGGYSVEMEDPTADLLGDLLGRGEIEEILSISGIAHDPKWTWRFAFRVDTAGPKIASNAPAEGVKQIEPRLRAAAVA